MGKILRAALLVAAVAVSAFAPAQSLQDYVQLRKHYGITRAAGVEALGSFVGSRVVEIQGVIKGSFTVDDRSTLMLEKAGGGTEMIESDALPEWLQGNEISARLLVRATRATAGSSLYAKLIMAAPETSIAKIEANAARKAVEDAKKTKARSQGPSRGGPPRKAAREYNLPANEVTPIYAGFIKNRNKKLTDAEAYRIAQGIIGFSLKYGVDARLIMAMVMVESDFDPKSTSRSGAMGLGQLMPGTAKWMGVNDAYDSIDNLSGTVKLVRTHLDEYRAKTGEDFNSLVLALAAYNAGDGAVKRHGGVPPYRETQNYVRRVVGLYFAFCGRKS